MLAALHLPAGESTPSTSTPAETTNAVARAQKAFRDAQSRFRANTNDVTASWTFARACFDLAEFAAENRQRAGLAETGIRICRQTIARNAGVVQLHYYLGMNLGQLARTRTLGALRLVDQMEAEFLRARALDEKFDFAGPHRNLGLLYLEAPSFGSIGSRSKARHHLRRAVELAPDYPGNRLNLIEALLRWGERAEAARELKTLGEQWNDAQKKYSGPDWASSWAEWQKRFDEFKAKAGVASAAS
jgi:tetratricopeptide (TPR) repeat protein